MPLTISIAFVVFGMISAVPGNNFTVDLEETTELEDFRLLLQEIMVKSLMPYKCVVVLSDPMYSNVFDGIWFKRFGTTISYIKINIDESEDLLAPSNDTQQSLMLSKTEGCQMYIILVANGIQVSRLFRYGDRYRMLDTLSKYVVLHDNRLFEKQLLYLWKRIINVVVIKRYGIKKQTHQKETVPWYEISTVPFPVPITNALILWRVDIWRNSKFRKGVDLFRDKTYDIQNQTMKVVSFEHLPGVAKTNLSPTTTTVRAVLDKSNDHQKDTVRFTGTEIEILVTISKAMNFRCELYEPEDADVELWGRKLDSGLYTGIIGEMLSARSDLALGDLYYTPYLLDLMDLSVPYNTECLTFLTPEALTDNSWKTLILPFRPTMWMGVLLSLLVCILAFHYLARFHIHIMRFKNDYNKRRPKTNTKPFHKQVVTLSIYPEEKKLNDDQKYVLMKEKYKVTKDESEPEGLYQFSEPVNSALYTYSMLLLVSLPKLPTGWSLRMLTGWYWLYCLLLVTSYRASMTAILAKPTLKVTIDTIEELTASKLTYGGWGELNMEFFKSSSDPVLALIAKNFVMVNESDRAVDRVAEASFAFYENTYFLKDALVKRQQRFAADKLSDVTGNVTHVKSINATAKDRSLHIMRDCIINMPVSIGLQKNSPLKPRVDKYIQIFLEAGLIKKWLDDSMQKILNTEVKNDDVASSKALMNLKKFSGAVVALASGYFLSIMSLSGEIIYFNYVVRRNPNFNKYSRNIHVNK